MKYSLNEIEQREVVPGFDAKFIHSETMTAVYWEIKAGNVLPKHSHPHEQIFNMLHGEFELTVEGNTYHLKTGDVFVLYSNIEHSGIALTDCKILDVFQPVRKDYVFE